MLFAKKIAVFLLCLICFQTANANWTKQNSNTLAWLRTVYFVNEKTGWIGGSNGTLLTTKDGGDSWKQAEKFTGDVIRQIYFADENNGWLLCERDIYSLGANSPSYLLKTKNGGADWEKIEFLNNGRVRIAKIFLCGKRFRFCGRRIGRDIYFTGRRKNVEKTTVADSLSFARRHIYG